MHNPCVLVPILVLAGVLIILFGIKYAPSHLARTNEFRRTAEDFADVITTEIRLIKHGQRNMFLLDVPCDADSCYGKAYVKFRDHLHGKARKRFEYAWQDFLDSSYKSIAERDGQASQQLAIRELKVLRAFALSSRRKGILLIAVGSIGLALYPMSGLLFYALCHQWISTSIAPSAVFGVVFCVGVFMTWRGDVEARLIASLGLGTILCLVLHALGKFLYVTAAFVFALSGTSGFHL